jgi:hypothetical protein
LNRSTTLRISKSNEFPIDERNAIFMRLSRKKRTRFYVEPVLGSDGSSLLKVEDDELCASI